MDVTRFDRWARQWTAPASRRAAVAALASDGLAVWSLARPERADARRCQVVNNRCQVNKDCCTRRCREGHCVCKVAGERCRFDGACCSEQCSANGEQGFCASPQ